MEEQNIFKIQTLEVFHILHGVRSISANNIKSGTLVCYLTPRFKIGYAFQDGNNIVTRCWNLEKYEIEIGTIPRGQLVIAFEDETTIKTKDELTEEDFQFQDIEAGWFLGSEEDLVAAELRRFIEFKDLINDMAGLTVRNIQDLKQTVLEMNMKNRYVVVIV